MTDAPDASPPGAAPPKKSNTLKWVLLGCGGIVALGVLCFGGCFAVGYFGIKKTGEKIAPVGEAYLRSQSEIEAELGKLTRVEWKFLKGTQINVEPNGGKARLTYEIEGPKGTGEATVWFERIAGEWTAVGCEVRLSSGKAIRIGRSVGV